ncbi:hypothetical protein AVEN_269186-2 [Araneus ventricosus]|nr:hypothetical protein AVEN_269186-2 [Araneus ventricosus]
MSNCRKSCTSVVFPLGNERSLHQQRSYGEALDCDVTNLFVFFLRTAPYKRLDSKQGTKVAKYAKEGNVDVKIYSANENAFRIASFALNI